MTRVELTFLGTSAGIPTPKRNHPAIYFRYVGKEEKVLLFDCGEGTQRQLFASGENYMKIDHVFITHWHADHYAGLLGMIETMSLEKRKRPIHVYAPEASRFLPLLLQVGYGLRSFEVISYDVPFRGKEITEILKEKEFSIFSIPVRHGVPAVAYCFQEKDRIKVDKKAAKRLGLPAQGKVYRELKEKGSVIYKGRKIELFDVCYVEKGKKVVYSGDTTMCSNLLKLARDADLLVLDCTYFDAMEERNHLSLEQAIEIAKKTNAKRVILTHVSRRYQDERELENRARKVLEETGVQIPVKIARDFMKVVIK